MGAGTRPRPGRKTGTPFDAETIQKVWEKGQVTATSDPDVWRKDQYGAWIRRDDYGYRASQLGWEIAYITTPSERGGTEVSNLRPFHWENMPTKERRRLVHPVTASGRVNRRESNHSRSATDALSKRLRRGKVRRDTSIFLLPFVGGGGGA